MSAIDPAKTAVVSISILARLRAWWIWWITPRSTNRDDAFRERTIRGMVPVLALLLLASSLFIIVTKQATTLSFPVVLSVVIISAAFVIAYQRLNLAAVLMFLFPVLAAIVSLSIWGYLSPAGIVMSYLAVVFGAIVLPRKVINYLPIGLIILYGIVAFKVGPHGPIPTPADVTSTGPLAQTIEMAILSMLFFGAGYYLLNEFERRRVELAQLVGSLEDRVAARTRDLSLAADVAKRVSTELVLDQLLPQIAERTREGFNLYSVAVFLLDDDSETLRYEAGTGSVGQQQKAARRHFKLSDQGIVPKAARMREIVLANNVAMQNDYQSNNYLPETHAELCLPMLVGNSLMGVLDLQSEQAERFTEDDVKVMTTLSEQLAVAIQNARLYEQQIQIAEQLRAVDTMKSQFLASMSHELRTPLNAILNFTEFVSLGMLGPINDQQADALDKAIDSGKHLLSLINDVLDMTKIESGGMKLFITGDIDLHAELEPAVATAKTLLKNKSVTLVEEIDPVLPRISGDQRRIRQILLNLISNAAKFTEEGSITLRVKNQGNEVLFAVIDTGPGIAREDQARIFEPFVQTETGIIHAGGTGLGLPISKRLAEAHGGRLWVESEPGAGAAFYVTLPLKPVELSVSTQGASE